MNNFKSIFILLIVLSLSGCSGIIKEHTKSTLSVFRIVNNPDYFEENKVRVKGELKIFNMGYISLYHPTNHKLLIDLAVSLDMVPEGQSMTPNEFYCVIVEGEYKNYSNTFLAFNMRSKYGRILVENVIVC